MSELHKTKPVYLSPVGQAGTAPRLTGQLIGWVDRKLTLIAVPAGFGKTTL